MLPLIDVLLVLLVFFMLVNARVRQAIPLQVPPTDVGGGRNQIVLDLPADRGFTINGQPVLDSQLETVLGAIFGNRPTKLLFVKVSGNRTYQEVVTAVDRAPGCWNRGDRTGSPELTGFRPSL